MVVQEQDDVVVGNYRGFLQHFDELVECFFQFSDWQLANVSLVLAKKLVAFALEVLKAISCNNTIFVSLILAGLNLIDLDHRTFVALTITWLITGQYNTVDVLPWKLFFDNTF